MGRYKSYSKRKDDIRFKYDRNHYIKLEKFRVITEGGENLGVLSKSEALKRAIAEEKDLVLISPNPENPVAKIMDWSKFKYEKSKKARQSKSSKSEQKEWWFKPNIEDRDLEMKLKKVENFLEKGGNKAKLTVKYVRRARPDQMQQVMEKLLSMSEKFGEPVSKVLREGRNLAIYIKSK